MDYTADEEEPVSKNEKGKPRTPAHKHLVQKKDGKQAKHKTEGTGATFSELGNNSQMTITNSKIQVIAETKIQASKEDLRCSQLTITQPEEVPGEYVDGVMLQWYLPKPENCKITGLEVLILSDSGPAVKKPAASTETSMAIYGKKLKCGCKYKAAVITKLKHCDGERFEVSTEWEQFITRPGRPKEIKADCQENSVSIQWSAASGSDKFIVSIYKSDISKDENPLHCEEAPGIRFSCDFRIDETKKIRLGEEYFVEVVAIRADLENHSGKTKLFFGDSCSPKSVKARIVDGTNKAMLSWEKPGWSVWGYKYLVEVIPRNGPVQRLPETNGTCKEIPDLKSGMSYTFRVRTSEGSLWSTSNVIETEECNIMIENFRVETNEDDQAQSLDCIWDENADASEYEILCKSSTKAVVLTVAKEKTRHTITGLTPNTTYKVAIRGGSKAGYGQYTTEEEKSTGLGQPKDVCLRVVNVNNIKVTFVGAIAATHHRITIQDDEGNEDSATLTFGETEHLFSGLRHHTEYRASLTAFYGDNESSSVQSERAMTAPEPPLVDDIISEPIENHSDSSFTLFFEIDDLIESCQAEIKCEDENTKGSIIEMFTDKKESRAFLNYKGFYKGVVYTAKVRIKNSGGFSDWSGEKAITTVPRKIATFTICCVNEQVVAKWENVERAESNTIILFKEGLEVCKQVHNGEPPFTFTGAIEHGLEYHCEIFPENETGPGRTTKSNILLAPLDPPVDLKLKDENNQVTYSWTPSTGMRSARITFSNSQLEELELTTRETEWSYKVTNGEVYTFSIWAQTGKALSEDFLAEEIVTAPSAVIVRRNAINPETCLDVEVVTKYNGPFLLTWRDVEKTEKGLAKEVTIPGRIFTIENLKPATEYSVHAVCVFGKNKKKSKECHSDEIMTMPAKVTGVTCTCRATEECKELIWNTCGNNSVQYTINWSRNNIFFEPITTETTTWKFKNLESGKYSFRVSAGGGKKSDECFVIIPDAPQMKLEIISWKAVRVVFSPKTLTEEKYQIKVRTSDEVATSSDVATSGEEKQFETKKCKFIIDKALFTFKKGVEYTVTSRAFWKDQSGPATVMEFITGLDIPTELTCKRYHDDPYRMVKFTWLNSVGVHSAKIQLRELDNQLVVEDFTAESNWKYWGLEKNRTYEFFLWPGDGQNFFDNDCVRHKFTTAPDPPKSVCCAPYETGFRVEIESDFDGNFKTEVRSKDQTCVTEPRVGPEKSFVISGLKPNTQYWIFTKCLFGKGDVDDTRETYADVQQSN